MSATRVADGGSLDIKSYPSPAGTDRAICALLSRLMAPHLAMESATSSHAPTEKEPTKTQQKLA